MSNSLLYLNFDLRKAIALLKQDPVCLGEIQAGLEDAPIANTTPLGSVQVDDDWYSVFAGTNREKASGEAGMVYRTKVRETSDGPKGGDRIKLNLRKQTKNHAAQVAGPGMQVPATPVQMTPEVMNALQAFIGAHQGATAAYAAPENNEEGKADTPPEDVVF
jgi:hypothetical protein